MAKISHDDLLKAVEEMSVLELSEFVKALGELVPTLGLKEAKDLVDAAPKEVMTAVNKKTAEEAKEKLTAAGATVELK
jgi:large subunit ribosomal protein L7/L12